MTNWAEVEVERLHPIDGEVLDVFPSRYDAAVWIATNLKGQKPEDVTPGTVSNLHSVLKRAGFTHGSNWQYADPTAPRRTPPRTVVRKSWKRLGIEQVDTATGKVIRTFPSASHASAWINTHVTKKEPSPSRLWNVASNIRSVVNQTNSTYAYGYYWRAHDPDEALKRAKSDHSTPVQVLSAGRFLHSLVFASVSEAAERLDLSEQEIEDNIGPNASPYKGLMFRWFNTKGGVKVFKSIKEAVATLGVPESTIRNTIASGNMLHNTTVRLSRRQYSRGPYFLKSDDGVEQFKTLKDVADRLGVTKQAVSFLLDSDKKIKKKYFITSSTNK